MRTAFHPKGPNLIWFLGGVCLTITIFVVFTSRLKPSVDIPPAFLRISADDPSQPTQIGALLAPDTRPVSVPRLTTEQLTEELSRRVQRPSTDKKIIYDSPCNGSGVGACVDKSCQHPLKYSPLERVEKLTASPQLSLSPEQRRTVLSLGDGIPTSDVIIASAASSNHFAEMQAMFQSLHTVAFPLLEERIEASNRDAQGLQRQDKIPIFNFTVVLFDIGLSRRERVLTEKNCRCKVITFHKNLFPAHVSDNHCYAWKPIMIMAASQHARKLLVWQDASVRWHSLLTDSLDRAFRAGHQVLRYIRSHRVTANTLREMFDYMRDDPCGYNPYPEIQGNIHIHRTDAFNRQVLFEPWVRCALEKQCFCPRAPGSVLNCAGNRNHRCHRFDQSAMSILLSRMYEEDLWKVQFQEFSFKSEISFRVLRGDNAPKYFKH